MKAQIYNLAYQMQPSSNPMFSLAAPLLSYVATRLFPAKPFAPRIEKETIREYPRPAINTYEEFHNELNAALQEQNPTWRTMYSYEAIGKERKPKIFIKNGVTLARIDILPKLEGLEGLVQKGLPEETLPQAQLGHMRAYIFPQAERHAGYATQLRAALSSLRDGLGYAPLVEVETQRQARVAAEEKAKKAVKDNEQQMRNLMAHKDMAVLRIGRKLQPA